MRKLKELHVTWCRRRRSEYVASERETGEKSSNKDLTPRPDCPQVEVIR